MLELIPLLGYGSCWIKEQEKTIFFTFFRSLSKPLVSPRNDVRETNEKIPCWWRITTRKQISHAARPIRIALHSWVVSRHQYGIAALVSQTSFWGASRNVGCFLRLVFSQLNKLKVLVYLFERGGLSNPIKWFTFHLCSERGITEGPVKEPCRGAGQSEEPSPYYS